MTPQSWVGRTIGGRYQLEALLGAGGMSAVYRGVDPNLRRVVAVKLIHPHLSTNPNFVDRFKEEAAAVASLRHPNIVQVYDFNNEDETYYMVMEYLAGETLQARLRRLQAAGRRLPLADALNISLQICDAAGYAHRHDLVHRDIKPANIMLDVHGQAILMDFGIVKIVGGQYHTATGATIGTAIYMSPEQIRSERVDERSDIYAMGVMLFEMLSGRPPYEADSALTLMMMHLNDPIPDPCELRSDVPPELAAVVLKALAKDRRQRYQTAAEMAGDVQKILAKLHPAAEPTPTLAEDAPPSPSARTRWLDEAAVATIVQAAEPEQAPPAAAKLATEAATLPLETAAAETIPLETAPSEAPTAEPAPTPPEVAPSPDKGEGQVEGAPPPARTRWLDEASVATIVQAAEPKQAQPPSPAATQPLEAAGAETTLLEAAAEAPEPAVTLPLEAARAETTPLEAPAGETPAAESAPTPAEGAPSSYQGEGQGEPAPRRQARLRLLLVGLGLLAIVAIAAAWFINQRRPPAEQLMPIERPSAPIELGTYTKLVNLGQWQIDSLSDDLAFSPDTDLLASTSNRDWVRYSPYKYYASLWQVVPGKLQAHLQNHTDWVYSLDFLPDGTLLATSGEDGRINLWQGRDGALLRTIEPDLGAIGSLDFSPNGKLLAGATWGGVALWQVSNGNLLRTYATDENSPRTVAFSPDGELLAASNDSGQIFIWQVSDQALHHTLQAHTAQVNQLAFSPDGSHLVSASDDKTIKIWQVSDGALLYTLEGHTEGVSDVAFSPDGSLLASAGWDATLRLWQASDGQALQTIENNNSFSAVTFSPDGAWLVAADHDHLLHFWGISEAISRLP